MDKFKSSNILITGGSQGLGRALAFEFGRLGAQVVIVARDEAKLRATTQALHTGGIEAHGIADDVGDPASALRIAGQAHASLGHIDILIHNASTLGPVPMPELSALENDAFARVLQVNLLGPHRLTRAIGGNMLLRGSGTIVAISSDAAISPYPGWGAYSAAKIALDHMTKIWAAETEGAGLRFLCIDPGEMNTKMHAQALPEADPTTLASPAETAKRIVSIIAAPERAATGARIEAQGWEMAS